MKTHLAFILFTLTVFTLLSFLVLGEEGDHTQRVITSGEVSLTVVYDNYSVDSDLQTSWGFGCVVKTEKTTVLFDTGGDGSILLSNMKKVGRAPGDVDVVAISHVHGDHVGGLAGFLEDNNQVTVYIPASLPDSTREMIGRKGARYVDITESRRIVDDVHTAGELGTWIKEQSLIVESTHGLIIVTGCAHPGVVNIVKKAKAYREEEVHLVMGGFHLMGTPEGELLGIVDEFRKMNVNKVAPSHCSGDLCRELFEEEYGEDFIDSGVGRTILID